MKTPPTLRMDKPDYNPFPDVPAIIQAMDIRLKLESIHSQGMYATTILLALDNKKPLRSVLKMIVDGYEEAPSEILDIVDKETIQQIKALYYAKH